ncbi:MAG: putative DNA-binding domain-containing protein [Methylotenera sp.]|nr:putative DNA-binding domain-containing protein [Methylotenera sp.]
MTDHLLSFQRYQQAFTSRIRDPHNQPIPAGVAPERMAVYDEIVFNNLFESASACFPVARKTVGKRIWLKLVQSFLKDYATDTPLFRKIPQEFLTFLQQTNLASPQQLPVYLQALCHYEWIELYLSTFPSMADNASNINPNGDLAKHSIVFTNTMQLLEYDYAVHKISPKHKPNAKEPTQLLVYRNPEYDIKFMELNPITFRLLTLCQQESMTAEQALTMLAEELKHPQPEPIIQFGLGILEDLRGQGAILGTARSHLT